MVLLQSLQPQNFRASHISLSKDHTGLSCLSQQKKTFDSIPRMSPPTHVQAHAAEPSQQQWVSNQFWFWLPRPHMLGTQYIQGLLT